MKDAEKILSKQKSEDFEEDLRCDNCNGLGYIVTNECCNRPLQIQQECVLCKGTGMKQFKRATGYYWVLLASSWIVGAYDRDYDLWIVIGMERHFNESDFNQIDESQIIQQPTA